MLTLRKLWNMIRNKPMCLLQADTQSINNITNTELVWDEVFYDNRQHFNVGDPTKITIRESGLYLINTNFLWAPNGTGLRWGRIFVNGTEVVEDTKAPLTSEATNHFLTTNMRLNKGDYIEIQVRQGSGGALNVTGYGFTSPNPRLEVIKLN